MTKAVLHRNSKWIMSCDVTTPILRTVCRPQAGTMIYDHQSTYQIWSAYKYLQQRYERQCKM